MEGYKMRITNNKLIQFSLIIIITSLVFFGCGEEKILPLQVIHSNMPEGGYEIDINDTLIISPKITYDYNTQYEWILNNEIVSDRKEFTLLPDSALSTTYLLFRVTSDRGEDTTQFIIHRVKILRFEELILKKDSFWTDPNNEDGFYSSDIYFPTHFEKDSNKLSGFIYSNRTTKKTLPQFCAYPGYGFDKSDNYLIYYHDTTSTNRIVLPTSENHVVKSLNVANTYYTYSNITNGINNIKLNINESLELIIKGFDSNDLYVGEIKYYLAKKDANNFLTKNSNWTEINLSELGLINQLEFEIKTNPDTALYIPGNIGIDNIVIGQ